MGQAALAAVTLALCSTFVVEGGDMEFVDVGAARGIGPYVMADGMAGGLAAEDFDDDGDIDLFVPNGQGVADQLYRNLGNGFFEEVAGALGVASTESARAALWLDVDGDDLLDLVVAGDGWHAQIVPAMALRLYKQTAPDVFQDVSAASGLGALNLDNDASHIGGLCAGDFNGDGSLDLCMSQWDGSTYLFLNDGAGVFTDVSAASGLASGDRTAWQIVVCDADSNGLPDIFVAVDFDPNHLWVNQGDGTFVDQALSAGVSSGFNEMGATIGDYDNDQDFDLYVTNVFENGKHNRLYRRESGAGIVFVDVAALLGVENTAWGWGTTFFDADLDGWLDLCATNGFELPAWRNDQSRFFLNRGGTPDWFEDVSAEVSFDDTRFGSCVIAADIDRDGDLDLTQTCNLGDGMQLMENRLTGDAALRTFLVVKPRMDSGNTRAIGAIVRVTAGGVTQSRMVGAGTSMMGQEPAEAHFGLGNDELVDALVIEWPGGGNDEFYDVQTGRIVTLRPGGCDGDADRNTVVDVRDIARVIFHLGAAGSPGGAIAGDVNADGVVDVNDIAFVILRLGSCQ